MRLSSFFKKSVYAWAVFFGTVLVLSVGYTTWNSAMTKVSSGSTLSSDNWNSLVDNITDLDSRWSRNGAALVFTGGNVGIGTASPSAKLDISGTLKIADGTQGDGRILTSDANGVASWSDPSYQAVSVGQAAGIVVSAANDSLVTSDITLTKGVWLLNIGYQMGVAATNGIWDVHIDAAASSGGMTTLSILPNFNSETAYAITRWDYLSTTQLVSVTTTTAAIHARRFGAYGNSSNYTINGATLTMIATKVR